MSPRLLGAATAPIRGEVLRVYRVRTVADVDWHLRRLKVWLAKAIEQAPARTLEHIRRYQHDVDALLDVRLELL